jgi:rhodanese-related sulfurtransferase
MTTPDPTVAFLEAKLATETGPHEAREAVEAGTAILLDVRSAESRAKVRIPDSRHIPRRELEARLGELPKGKTVVAYCSDLGCQASLKATIILRRASFDAKHLIGGVKFWQEKGYPTESGAEGRSLPVSRPA